VTPHRNTESLEVTRQPNEPVAWSAAVILSLVLSGAALVVAILLDAMGRLMGDSNARPEIEGDRNNP
jgi:hypothetical protein